MLEHFSGKIPHLPSWDQLRATLRAFTTKERRLTLLLLVGLAVGFFGTLHEINERFSILAPAPGGAWREGIIGSPRFVNPLLAISDADRDVAGLVFSGLARPDGKGNLIPDLAENYEISKDGLSYTFSLRPGARFHDGEALTADDIVFTVALAKNQVLKSPVRGNWEGVEVEKIDQQKVRFWLKRPYAQFLENTTLGILPQHLWKDIPPGEMSLSELNIRPTGSGPYELEEVNKEKSGILSSYTLAPFRNYALGKPYLKKIVLKFYPSEVELLGAFEAREIDAMSAISPQNVKKLSRTDHRLLTLQLPRVFGVFFNQNENLFVEKGVRQALDRAVDKKRIIDDVLKGYGTPISSPLSPGTFGALDIPVASRDLAGARELLEKAGWKQNPETKIYEKQEKQDKKKVTRELSFTLSTSNAPDLVQTASLLKENWQELGVKMEIKVFEISDLNQNVLRPRQYQALLFGEVVGRDPDPFAFWHSSQRGDPGLNIALYASSKVDKILEEARSTIQREERRKKYEEFQREIIQDAPAVFLYSPSYLYMVPRELKGFETRHILIPAERFAESFRWHFETLYVWKIFTP